MDSFTQGAILGLSAGLSPGPLLTFVISETLMRGTGAGFRAASAPLLTDAPIIGVCFLILKQAAEADLVLGLVALAGCGLLLMMGYENITAGPMNTAVGMTGRSTLKRAVTVNFLSPHPYLFWISIGVPIMLTAGQRGLKGPALFLLAFYAMLVGAKLMLAFIVGKYRMFLSGAVYRYTIKALGVVLVGFALMLLRDAGTLLGLSWFC